MGGGDGVVAEVVINSIMTSGQQSLIYRYFELNLLQTELPNGND